MMRKKWFIALWITLAYIGLVAGCWLGGMAIGDAQARKAALDDEIRDVFELVIEYDRNVTIKEAYYDLENGKGYYLVRSNYNPEQYYTIRIELKKVAPFRYEWVEVDL